MPTNLHNCHAGTCRISPHSHISHIFNHRSPLSPCPTRSFLCHPAPSSATLPITRTLVVQSVSSSVNHIMFSDRYLTGTATNIPPSESHMMIVPLLIPPPRIVHDDRDLAYSPPFPTRSFLCHPVPSSATDIRGTVHKFLCQSYHVL